MYDPVTGEWIEDDDMAAWNAADPLQPLAFMQPDLSTGGNFQAYDAASQGRGLGNLQKLLAIRRDPFFNYLIAAETGQDTFPFEQLMMPGNPWLQDPTGLGGSGSSADYNALAGGGGGGGGGYGGGGGGGLPAGVTLDPTTGELVPNTPYLTANMQAADPYLAQAAQDIAGGVSPAQVKAQMYEAIEDPDLRAIYASEVDTMFKERVAADQGMRQGPGVGEPSELAKTAAKWGITDPLAQYGPGNLPDDVAMNLTGENEQATTRSAMGADRAAAMAERNAVYLPVDTEGAGVRLPQTNAPRRESGGVREAGTNRWLPNETPAEGRDAAASFVESQPEGFTPGTGQEWMTNVINPDGSIGAPIGNTRPNPYLPDSGESDGGGFMRSIARQAQERESPGLPGGMDLLQFLSSPKSREAQQGPMSTITRNGRQTRTNSSGVQAQRQRQNAAYLRSDDRRANTQGAREAAVGYLLQRQGRTPQRDWAAAQTDYLRRMGIGI